jgi:DNA-binding transcriptional ArsR family regulator
MTPATKTTKQAAKQRSLDERLAKALSHPLRSRILTVYNDRVTSPNQVSQELDEPLGNVSYHTRILRDLGCLELVKTEPRRGAVEHYYRATVRPYLDDVQWSRLPASLRRQLTGQTLNEVWVDVHTAADAGGFDHPETHVSRSRLQLDEQGWREVTELLSDTLDRAFEIHAESAGRLTETGEEPFETMLEMMHFGRAAPARGKRAASRPRARK